jgi:hypothetical protein
VRRRRNAHFQIGPRLSKISDQLSHDERLAGACIPPQYRNACGSLARRKAHQLAVGDVLMRGEGHFLFQCSEEDRKTEEDKKRLPLNPLLRMALRAVEDRKTLLRGVNF